MRSSSLTTELDPVQQNLLRKMATPARLGEHVSKATLGWQWTAATHIRLIEERVLECLFDSRQRFLSISMPPRHGKSFYCSVFLAAWFLGMNPEKRVILITYSEDFAAKWGRTVRDILTKHGKELFGINVSKAATSSTDWYIENTTGGMLAVGIGGGITGQGGDLVIIDDLIKNQEEARSTARKEGHAAEYAGSIRTRLEPGGTMVYIGTRWAPDDLPGVFREPSEFGDQWEFLDFPALAEVPRLWDEEQGQWEDVLGRREGEALWPDRWDQETLTQIRHTLVDSGQALTWYALYQQDPRLSEDAAFPEDKWGLYPSWEAEQIKRECIRLVRSWDLASSKNKGDYTVGALMGLHSSKRVYIFDVIRMREGPTDVEATVINTAELDGHSVKVIIEQERSGSGNTVVAHYKRELLAFEVEGIPPEGKKEERISIYAAKQGAGLVLLPHEASWKQEWIREHKDFGYIRHDDQVDAGSQGFNDLAALGGGVTVWAPTGLNFQAERMLQDLLRRVA